MEWHMWPIIDNPTSLLEKGYYEPDTKLEILKLIKVNEELTRRIEVLEQKVGGPA